MRKKNTTAAGPSPEETVLLVSEQATPQAPIYDHLLWIGKGSGGHYARDHAGLRFAVTLERGVPLPIGRRSGECPERFANVLIEAGRAVRCTAEGEREPEAPKTAPDAGTLPEEQPEAASGSGTEAGQGEGT